jgi:hypothetical protein
VPFPAVGGDKDPFQAVTGKVPGISTADDNIVPVDHTVEALRTSRTPTVPTMVHYLTRR